MKVDMHVLKFIKESELPRQGFMRKELLVEKVRLLQNTLLLTMVDLFDHIWIIAGAVVNM